MSDQKDMARPAGVDYDRATMRTDIERLLRSSHTGLYSGRGLGDLSKLPLWTPDRIDQLWEGAATAWVRFYRKEVPSLKHFARMVLCECAQESTMDYRLGVKQPIDFRDHTSHGVIQVTPGSVLHDFARFGRRIQSALVGRRGVVLADPARVRALDFDTSNCAGNIVMFAWYTKNTVNMGMSMNEYAHRIAWNTPTAPVKRVFGTAQLTWLAGPRNSIDTHQAAYQDYYNRILDYWVHGGFGTKEEFDAHIQTPIVNELVLVTPECASGTMR